MHTCANWHRMPITTPPSASWRPSLRTNPPKSGRRIRLRFSSAKFWGTALGAGPCLKLPQQRRQFRDRDRFDQVRVEARAQGFLAIFGLAVTSDCDELGSAVAVVGADLAC